VKDSAFAMALLFLMSSCFEKKSALVSVTNFASEISLTFAMGFDSMTAFHFVKVSL
jgi:hypothetical protein